jgi:hypothetical protein
MRINLLDLGDEGRDFEYKKGDEAVLDNLVAEVIPEVCDFSVKVHLLPAGDIYLAQGSFTLKRNDECSLCAADMTEPIKGKINEYLMKEQEDMKGHAPHNGLNLDSKQEVTFVPGLDLDLAEFFREQFAASISPYPKCTDTAACEERQKENKKYYDDQKLEGHPAFSVLGQLKADQAAKKNTKPGKSK